MGVHRWLLGPLLCLIVASARPPECEQAPLWSMGRRAPLLESRGKQASSLESLLKHFRTYGMHDLQFMIVNSHLVHSQLLRAELERRVSFDVYQDTQEKNVWKMMGGGKDDVYVYDRCGRLAYFIPFPLSIMSAEKTLVPAAILATYYRSPCGAQCDSNVTTLEDYLRNIDLEKDTLDTPDDVVMSTYLYENNTLMYQTEDGLNLTLNETFVTEAYETLENKSEYSKDDDFDYNFYNDTIDDYIYESGNRTEDKNAYSDWLSFFFNSMANLNNTEEEVEPLKFTKNVSNSILDITDSQPLQNPDVNIEEIPSLIVEDRNSSLAIEFPDSVLEISNPTTLENPEAKHDQSSSIEVPDFIAKDFNQTTTVKPKAKYDRCIEADRSVCKNWSKKRLLKAQSCCSLDSSNAGFDRQCKHFGKKRCKKIHTILKCCLKTQYVETKPMDSSPSSTVEAQPIPATPQTPHIHPATSATPHIHPATHLVSDVTQVGDVTVENVHIVCCKYESSEKVCRLSLLGCDKDEVVSESGEIAEAVTANM